jgi:hypothetical protein
MALRDYAQRYGELCVNNNMGPDNRALYYMHAAADIAIALAAVIAFLLFLPVHFTVLGVKALLPKNEVRPAVSLTPYPIPLPQPQGSPRA